MRTILICALLLLNGKNNIPEGLISQEPAVRWRGGNVKPFIYEKGSANKGRILPKAHLERYKSWGINLLRVQIFLDKSSSFFASSRKKQKSRHNSNNLKSKETLDESYGSFLLGLDSVAAYCESLDLNFIISLHGVKDRYQVPDSLLTNLKEFWAYVAQRYHTNKNLVGYDLLNEPNTPYETSRLFRKNLYKTLIQHIRKYDTTRSIIVEVLQDGSADGFRGLYPLEDSNLIYSFHFYEPHQFTYQGVGGIKKTNSSYPGEIRPDGAFLKERYNKKKLKEDLQPVRSFQQEHCVPILVGEFSAVRWAPGAERYLKDALEIFEEYGWHWAYQNLYGEWNGWCLTIPNEQQNSYGCDFQTEQTKRFEVVSKFWCLNTSP